MRNNLSTSTASPDKNKVHGKEPTCCTRTPAQPQPMRHARSTTPTQELRSPWVSKPTGAGRPLIHPALALVLFDKGDKIATHGSTARARVCCVQKLNSWMKRRCLQICLGNDFNERGHVQTLPFHPRIQLLACVAFSAAANCSSQVNRSSDESGAN